MRQSLGVSYVVVLLNLKASKEGQGKLITGVLLVLDSASVHKP